MESNWSVLRNPKWWSLYLVGMLPFFAFMVGALLDDIGTVSYFVGLTVVAAAGVLTQRWLMRTHNIQQVVA